MDNSVLLLVANALFYVVLLYYIVKKSLQGFSATSFVVGWYLFAAISSVLFYTHPFTAGTEYYNPIEWQGLLYFNVLTLVLMYPLFQYEKRGYEVNHSISDTAILTYIKVLLVMNLVVLISYMPDAIRIMDSNLGDLRDAATIGDTSTVSRKNPLVAWTMTFTMSLRNISTIIAFYAIVFVQENKKLVKTFFVVAMVMPFFLSFLFVMRSFMVFHILLVFFMFLLYRKMFTSQTRKKLYIFGVGGLVGVILILIFISNDRFGNMVSWFYYKYAGETFVNFAGQMWPDFKESTGGTIYFPWIRRMLGMDYQMFDLSEKWQYMNNITGIDTHIFYGFIGGLIMEFNFIPAAIICCVISFLFNKFIKSSELRLSNLILIGSLANLLFTGSFLFIYQGIWGNFEIIFIVLVYLYIRRKENAYQSLNS